MDEIPSVEESLDLLSILNLLKAKNSKDALSQLLSVAIKQIGAEGGTFYSYHNHCLYPIYVINKTLNINWVQTDGEEYLSKETAIHLPSQPENFCVRSLQKQGVLIENRVQDTKKAKQYSKFYFDTEINYVIKSILTIPIFDESQPVGVFQLINAIDTKTRIERIFDAKDVEFAYMINEIASYHLTKIKFKKAKLFSKENIGYVISLIISLALIGWLIYLF